MSVLGDGGLFVGRPGVDGEADGLVVDGEGLGQYRPCAAVAAAAVLVALGHPDANSNGNGRRREQTKGYEGLPRTDEEAEHIPLVDLGGRLDGHLGALLGEGAGDRQAAGVLRVGGGGGMGGGGRSDALLDVAVAHLLLPSELRGRHVGDLSLRTRIYLSQFGNWDHRHNLSLQTGINREIMNILHG